MKLGEGKLIHVDAECIAFSLAFLVDRSLGNFSDNFIKHRRHPVQGSSSWCIVGREWPAVLTIKYSSGTVV